MSLSLAMLANLDHLCAGRNVIPHLVIKISSARISSLINRQALRLLSDSQE